MLLSVKTQSYTYNNTTYSSPISIIDTFSNINGCDSVVYFNLTVDSFIYINLNINICSGSSYQFGSQTLYNSVNNLRDTIINPNGCDTVKILNLVVSAPKTKNVNATICKNQTYTYRGYIYK